MQKNPYFKLERVGNQILFDTNMTMCEISQMMLEGARERIDYARSLLNSSAVLAHESSEEEELVTGTIDDLPLI
ncbi:MAG: hypothetical protein AAF847_00250 [Bacteroidota bacterium]